MRLLLALVLFAKSLLRTTGCLASRMLREHWRWVVIPAAWALMSYLILDYTSSQVAEKRWESLVSMCHERARMLKYQVNVSMNSLQALAILISTFHHSKNPSSAIDQMTFARYAERTVFERPLTSGVAYGVRVNCTEREQFERQQGWSIKKMYSSKTKKLSRGPGNATVAEVREPAEEYAPVIFAQDTYENVISFDLLSGAVSTLSAPSPAPSSPPFPSQRFYIFQ
ncbi:unnamed protein product [Miscanthus lutarioriparius]|uniref:CHASE domain-containing protein n=1 Tax=Miscanthus lutarioriparius TaxID=422564 RepID=A0A811RLG9_9POAL|nr:unnamed protein product [Miscanthus lutarioriparius]